MGLKEFFVKEVGVPEEYWEDNESRLRELSSEAVYRYVNWLYGYTRYGRGSLEVTVGISDRLERKDECLGFLSKKVLESELPEKPMIIEKLTGLAFESFRACSYPIMDVLNYLSHQDRIMELEHAE
ncbi:hypothetical protein AKJ35_01140 [candidate division MSBL1 archaeon SCGC-AAA833F18]|uniref:Uncharacterized protein n=1 Tax=candidate division MSBL1 archaeon SCGC-AAA833F18 TaxID=1698257 RepID=A0A133VS66_9EURY|nr:hypothetical protein AKJ35_01140 [candidate division MSBL1 archaeon SCGC-AAA833F18]